MGKGDEGEIHHGSNVSHYPYCYHYYYGVDISLSYHPAWFVWLDTNMVKVVFVFRMYQHALWCHASP